MADLCPPIWQLLSKLFNVQQLVPDEYAYGTDYHALSSLESALRDISEVVVDAEEEQLGDSVVRDWLQRLEDAVYDAEDVVDEMLYEYEVTRHKPELAESQILKSFARTSLTRSREGARLLREIANVFDNILKEKDKFGFKKLQDQHDELQLSLSDSFPDGSTAIYGREDDMNNVVRLLLSSPGDANLDVIAIVGMGGLGKTTLAQLVYKDEHVCAHFQLKAWVRVGMDFNVHSITGTILEAAAISNTTFEGYPLDEVVTKLSVSLAGKKCLLVIDGVWRVERISKWRPLQSCLKSGAGGSKILITTRSKQAAAQIGCSSSYELNPLREDDCWSLFAKSAFAGRRRSEVKTLQHIGRRFVEKCQGIPLYTRAIGGLLRFKKTPEEWRDIMEDLDVPFANKAGDSLSPILLSSYLHLPRQLKRCFAYCSLFPKDYEFDKEELLLLWMGEGFLQQPSRRSMEKVGAEYFDGLLKRSFFIPVDNSYCFKMHDLMHDLAAFASKTLCLRLESDDTMMKPAISKRTRHLSLLSSRTTLEDLSVILETKRLRTFSLIKSLSDPGPCQLSSDAWKTIFARLQRSRVLSLPHFNHSKLPASIGELKCLHYLDLSHSALESLPASLCTLYYLQTLLLTNCYSLRMLPKGIVKLVNLRNLHIKGAGLRRMPENMGSLRSLRSLTNFIVGHGGSSITELGALLYLQGSLCVSELQNVSSAFDASKANLKALHYLDELELKWSSTYEDPTPDHEEVLERLKPPMELKKLSIQFYGGKQFPKWLGDSSFLNITSLYLADCDSCKSLPPLGQLSSLKHLNIERMSGLKSIGREFYWEDVSGWKPFRSLKTLKFGEMSEWGEWLLLDMEGEEFPCLEELYIFKCPKLKGGLPKILPTLIKLEISECDELEASLPQTSDCCVLKLYKCYKLQKRNNDSCPISSQLFPSIILQEQDDRQKISPQLSPSRIQQEQDDNQAGPSSSEDGNQQFSSLSENASSMGMDLPSDLNSLRIERYALSMLPKEIWEQSSLQHLYIVDCSSLKIFPQSPSLKTLYIHNCKNLEFPQPTKMHS